MADTRLFGSSPFLMNMRRAASPLSPTMELVGIPLGGPNRARMFRSAGCYADPPTFPDDIDWRSISFKLMYRILSLPNNARETDRYIAASAEHSFPPDYGEVFSARQEGYAHLGLKSVNLVKDLRREFKLPDTPKKFWDWGWDMEKFFQDKLAEFQKSRQASGKNEGLEL